MTIIYTDGACKGNGKATASAGGFGVYICYPDGQERHIWGGEPDTTNNRMELMATIVALKNTSEQPFVQIFTDSGYVKDGITQWIKGWKARGWKKADGKTVLNLDLWQTLDGLCQNRQIDWQWIKGHAGHHGNEMADMLANKGIDSTGDEWILPSHAPAHPQNSDAPKNDTPKKAATHTTQNQAKTPSPMNDTAFTPLLPTPTATHKKRQLILDTETTGFYPEKGERIVEIGVIEMIDRKATGKKLHVYLNPEKMMDDEVIRVHGITNEFVADKPKFGEVAQAVYDFLLGGEIVAHNASFDIKFLQAEFHKAGFHDFLNHIQVLDTLELAKQQYPDKKNSLDALVKRLNVGKKDRTFHGALLDAEILMEVYLAMTGGQSDLMGALVADTDTPPNQKIATSENPSLEQNPLYDGNTSKANPYFRPILPTPINRGVADRQLIMDTETTGFEDQNGDRIVEVGIIELVGRKFTGEKLHVYLNPEKIMDDEVIKVHGISNEFVADKPKFGEVAKQIYDFMAGAEIIAHNASFDMRFLTMEFDKAGLPDFANSVTVTDSLVLAKQMFPGQKNSLDALVKRLNVGKKDRTFHGALLDSEILAEVYLAMTGGQVALDIDVQEETQNEEVKTEDLSRLNHLLAKSVSDHSADSAWRSSIFG